MVGKKVDRAINRAIAAKQSAIGILIMFEKGEYRAKSVPHKAPNTNNISNCRLETHHTCGKYPFAASAISGCSDCRQ